jgi:hypothetical protein
MEINGQFHVLLAASSGKEPTGPSGQKAVLALEVVWM